MNIPIVPAWKQLQEHEPDLVVIADHSQLCHLRALSQQGRDWLRRQVWDATGDTWSPTAGGLAVSDWAPILRRAQDEGLRLVGLSLVETADYRLESAEPRSAWVRVADPFTGREVEFDPDAQHWMEPTMVPAPNTPQHVVGRWGDQFEFVKYERLPGGDRWSRVGDDGLEETDPPEQWTRPEGPGT